MSSDFVFRRNFTLNKYRVDKIEMNDEHVFDFSFVMGKITMQSDDSFELKFSDENQQSFFKVSPHDEIKFNDIHFHDSVSKGKNKYKLLNSALAQASIYHLYNVKDTYDFYNYPRLIVDNNFAAHEKTIKIEHFTELVKNFEIE